MIAHFKLHQALDVEAPRMILVHPLFVVISPCSPELLCTLFSRMYMSVKRDPFNLQFSAVQVSFLHMFFKVPNP